MPDNTLDLYQLLSDPLTATITADYEVADRYYTILKKYAFGIDSIDEDDEEEGITRKLQTISFDFINSEGKKQTAEIPLLTLMPLPLLHISEASFEFDVQMNVKSEAESPITKDPLIKTTALSKTRMLTTLNRAALVKVSVPVTTGSESTESSTNTNMKVHIKMQQSDMPIGLANILQTAADSMLISRTTGDE